MCSEKSMSTEGTMTSCLILKVTRRLSDPVRGSFPMVLIRAEGLVWSAPLCRYGAGGRLWSSGFHGLVVDNPDGPACMPVTTIFGHAAFVRLARDLDKGVVEDESNMS